MLPLGSNHLLCYVRLDERAKDLRTTTSSMQALSDEYPNNFCLITAVKITTLFRPGSNLSPRWTHKRSSRSSEPPADDCQSAAKWLPQKTQTLQKQDTTTTWKTETTDTYWITWHCFDYCRQTRQQSDWTCSYWASTETDRTSTQQRTEAK